MSEAEQTYAVVVYDLAGPTAVRGPFAYEHEAEAARQVIRLDPTHYAVVLPMARPDVADLHFAGVLRQTGDTAIERADHIVRLVLDLAEAHVAAHDLEVKVSADTIREFATWIVSTQATSYREWERCRDGTW